MDFDCRKCRRRQREAQGIHNELKQTFRRGVSARGEAAGAGHDLAIVDASPVGTAAAWNSPSSPVQACGRGSVCPCETADLHRRLKTGHWTQDRPLLEQPALCPHQPHPVPRQGHSVRPMPYRKAGDCLLAVQPRQPYAQILPGAPGQYTTQAQRAQSWCRESTKKPGMLFFMKFFDG
ncbi:hypothetical protein [Azotobacter armeniacus]